MHPLDISTFDYSIQQTAKGRYIFDIVRKKYVRLTPEEWTRQYFIHYLTKQLAYPKSLIRLEKGVRYNHRQNRPDIVVYSRTGKPWMLVECKALYIGLDAKSFQQLARYNVNLQAQLLVMTNGVQCCCWRISYAPFTYEMLPNIPCFDPAY